MEFIYLSSLWFLLIQPSSFRIFLCFWRIKLSANTSEHPSVYRSLCSSTPSHLLLPCAQTIFPLYVIPSVVFQTSLLVPLATQFCPPNLGRKCPFMPYSRCNAPLLLFRRSSPCPCRHRLYTHFCPPNLSLISLAYENVTIRCRIFLDGTNPLELLRWTCTSSSRY